jgi:hypothetical protein
LDSSLSFLPVNKVTLLSVGYLIDNVGHCYLATSRLNLDVQARLSLLTLYVAAPSDEFALIRKTEGLRGTPRDFTRKIACRLGESEER